MRAPSRAAIRAGYPARRAAGVAGRLRLEGELTELRADDLRFSLAEARKLFDSSG